MIIQKKNNSVRSNIRHDSDIAKIKEYYDRHGCFPIFRQVLIETRTDCNNHCPFCPHAFNTKELGIMEWETYCHIINELCRIKYNGRIALMLSNEPLLENRLVEMIKYAKAQSPRFFLDITTNGRLLDVELVDKLFSVGMDNININDYRGDRDKYPNKLSDNLIGVYNAYNNNPKVTFQYRSLKENLPNYGGNIPQNNDGVNYGFCNFPFRKLTISYKGDVLLCCNDFMYKTCFGNILSKNIEDCWYDERYNEIRFALLKNIRIDMCAECNDYQDYNAF